MIDLTRRGFVTGLSFVATSPAIVRAASIMPVRKIILPWTDAEWHARFIVAGGRDHIFIRPRAGIILTEADKEQAADYRRRLGSRWPPAQLQKVENPPIYKIPPGGFRGYCAFLPQTA